MCICDLCTFAISKIVSWYNKEVCIYKRGWNGGSKGVPQTFYSTTAVQKGNKGSLDDTFISRDWYEWFMSTKAYQWISASGQVMSSSSAGLHSNSQQAAKGNPCCILSPNTTPHPAALYFLPFWRPFLCSFSFGLFSYFLFPTLYSWTR